MEEKGVEGRIMRFHALLDRESAGTLSSDEANELAALETSFDREEAAELAPIQLRAAERRGLFDEALDLLEQVRNQKSMGASGD